MYDTRHKIRDALGVIISGLVVWALLALAFQADLWLVYP